MYFFDSIINTFKQTFTDLQAVGLAQNKSWTIAKKKSYYFLNVAGYFQTEVY